MIQPVCGQCQSMLEGYRQSVGHTQAKKGTGKYNLLYAATLTLLL